MTLSLGKTTFTVALPAASAWHSRHQHSRVSIGSASMLSRTAPHRQAPEWDECSIHPATIDRDPAMTSGRLRATSSPNGGEGNNAGNDEPGSGRGARLMDMAIAHWRAELILQAAEMSLADKFTGDEPRTADGPRGRIRHAATAIYRYLRSLTGLGLLASAGADSFRLTDLGAALKTGAPGAARSA